MAIVRWGLIGCGDISRKRVAPALTELSCCDLVAVNRSDSSQVQSFARDFSVQQWYETWEELLTDTQIDAVYVATPVYLHAPITVAAAKLGKHVLCEKPMGLNVDECEAMIQACRLNGVKLGIAYYRHFYPIVRRIKEILESGEIGRPVTAQINAFEYFNPSPGEARHWLLQKDASGGGPMFDFGCHRIEVLLNLFGHLKEAKGFVSQMDFVREVEDTATAFLFFQGGPHATLSVTHAALEPQDTLDIFATSGSLHVPVLNEETLEILQDNHRYEEAHPPADNLHQPLVEDFCKAILQDREPAVGGTLGKEINRILELIYKEHP